MRIGRRVLALIVTAGMIPVALLNHSASADSTWTGYRLPNSGSNSEPGIDIGLDANGDEVVYIHGTRGLPLHNQAWIRQPGLPEYQAPVMNQATGFKEILFNRPFDRLPGGGDADISFRGNDLWFIDLWAGSNSIQYSPDKGKTWTLGTPFTTLPVTDRQWIAIGDTVVDPVLGRQTTVYAVYQTFQPGDGMWLSRSRDNGLTWDFHTPIGGLGSGPAGIPAHIVSDGSKTVAVAVNSGGQFRVAVSKDEGASWTVNSVSNGRADAQGWAIGLSMNPLQPNELAITYPVTNAADGGPSSKTIVRTTSNFGANWSDAIRLEPGASVTGPMDWFPWVDYRGNKIAVAWYQSSGPVPGRKADNAPSTNKWHVFHSESLNDGATFSTPQQVTSVPAKSGPICTVGLSCTADRDLGDFLQIAIDTTGNSWIAMVHATPGPFGSGLYAYKQG